MSSLTASPGRPPNSLHFVVGEINGKLDQLILTLTPKLQELAAADEALDTRVTQLEIWQGRMLGAGSLVVFIVTAWEVIRYVIHF
jgi:hypothetical protein